VEGFHTTGLDSEAARCRLERPVGSLRADVDQEEVRTGSGEKIEHPIAGIK